MKLNKRAFSSIIPAVILVLAILAAFVITVFFVDRSTEEFCIGMLENTAERLSAKARHNIESNNEELQIISDIFSSHDNISSDIALNHISLFRQRGTISAIGLLLPDNSLILSGSDFDFMRGKLDFAQEAAKGEYISDVFMPSESGSFFLQSVPIKHDNIVIGIIYGFVSLSGLEESYKLDVYDGIASQYIISGNTGDFILNTHRKNPGNFFANDYRDKDAKNNYTFNSLDNSIRTGASGCIVQHSNVINSDFYMYYTPVGVKDWRALIAVPEKEALQNVISVRSKIYILMLVIILILVLYLILSWRNYKLSAAVKEREYKRMLEMYNIQQILLEAHKTPERMIEALDHVSSVMGAETTCLIRLEKGIVKKMYSTRRNKSYEDFFTNANLDTLLPDFMMRLRNGGTFISDKHHIHCDKQCDEIKSRFDVGNVIASPMLNSYGEPEGAVICINCSAAKADEEFPGRIINSLMLSVINIESNDIIEKMGTVDSLTGLRNRNSYNAALSLYTDENITLTGCIYIDANGLHELNNHLGHAAGDEMLAYIGENMRSIFKGNDIFRIGGDEFVILMKNCTKNDTLQKLEQLRGILEKRDYHISAGLACRRQSTDVYELVAEAEQMMYSDKREYYAKRGNAEKARQMNMKLERILLEKKDRDNFLSVISSKFMGVYVVDLKTDVSRIIYEPDYFGAILKRTNYKFKPAIKEYVRNYIHDDSANGILDLLDYSRLEKELEEQGCTVRTYKKSDNTVVTLHIYNVSSDSGSDTRETIWLFE